MVTYGNIYKSSLFIWLIKLFYIQLWKVSIQRLFFKVQQSTIEDTMELLATNSNPKLMKENSAEFEALTPQLNKKYFEIKENYAGTITGGVSIAPNTENGLGVDLCGGHSTKACRKGCLFIQGRGKMKPVASARVKKAVFFIKENIYFKLLNIIKKGIFLSPDL